MGSARNPSRTSSGISTLLFTHTGHVEPHLRIVEALIFYWKALYRLYPNVDRAGFAIANNLHFVPDREQTANLEQAYQITPSRQAQDWQLLPHEGHIQHHPADDLTGVELHLGNSSRLFSHLSNARTMLPNWQSLRLLAVAALRSGLSEKFEVPGYLFRPYRSNVPL